MNEKERQDLFDLMVKASKERNALIGIDKVVTKKEWIRDSRFSLGIDSKIEEQEQIIMDCYHKLTKDDE